MVLVRVTVILSSALTCDFRHRLDRVVRLDSLLSFSGRFILCLQLFDRGHAHLARHGLRLPALIKVDEGILLHVPRMVIVANVPFLILARFLSL